MAITREEAYNVAAVEGFACCMDHNTASLTGVETKRVPLDPNNPDEKEFHAFTFISGFPRQEFGTLRWAIAVMAQVGAYIIKALVLIFRKLDSIEDLLYEQELRERNKEGR